MSMRSRAREASPDLDPVAATDPGAWSASSYTYAHHLEYGCPELDNDGVMLLDLGKTIEVGRGAR